MPNLTESDPTAQRQAAPQPAGQAWRIAKGMGRGLRRGMLLLLLFLSGTYLWFTFYPPDLSRYAPEVSRFLSEQSGMAIRLQGLTLRLGGTVALSGDGVAIHPKAVCEEPFTARHLLLRLSPVAWAMNHPPLEAELVGMTLPLRRDESGSFAVVGLDMGNGEAKGSGGIPAIPFSSFTLRDVRLLFLDETAMTGEPVQLELDRIEMQTVLGNEGLFEFHGSVEMSDPEGISQKLKAHGQRDRDGRWGMSVVAEELRIAAYRYYLTGMPPLSGLELPVSVKLEARWGGGEPTGITWNLWAGEGNIFWPELFRWPLPVSALTATGAVVSADNQAWDLSVDHFDLLNEHGWGRGHFSLTGIGTGQSPILDLSAKAGGVPADKANFYYPTPIMSPDLVHWLDTSLSQGVVREARAFIRGPANNLFNLAPNPPGEAASTFLIEGDVSGGSLEYFPGAPWLTEIETQLVFDGLSMEARVDQARLTGSKEVRGFVRIADMMHAPVVEIQASAKADLASLWNDLMAAPRLRLDRTIGMDGTRMEGKGDLALHVALPLADLSQVSYDGTLQLEKARLLLPFLPAPVEEIQGTLHLLPEAFTLEKAQGVFEGFPVTATVRAENYRTPAQSLFHLTVDGEVPDDRLVSWLSPLLGEGGEMQGVAPLHLEIRRHPRDRIFHFNTRLDATDLSARGRLGWHKERQEKGEVTLYGAIGNDGTLHLETLQAELGNLKARGSGAVHTANTHLSLHFDPLQVDRSQGSVGVERDGEKWRVKADLDRLALPLPPDEMDEEGENDTHPTRAPVPPLHPVRSQEHLWTPWPETSVEIRAEQLLLAEEEEGKEFLLKLTTTPQELRIHDLHFLLGAGQTSLDGFLRWANHPGEGPYTGEFHGRSKDVGKLLRALDFHSGMADGEGGFSVELDGENPAGSSLVGSLSGQGEVHIEKGTIHRFQLLSTLLGLLSLRDLPGLLTGQRPDLQGNGFYYKRVHGDFTLEKGVWKSKNLKLIGPSMTILAVGSVDYTRDELDLLVGMQPWQFLDRIVTQVPGLGALAGGSRQSLLETQFDVTGSLHDPEVQIRPLSSLVPGILRDILQLPAKLLEQMQKGDLTPTGEAKSNGTDEEEAMESDERRFRILKDPFQSQGENP